MRFTNEFFDVYNAVMEFNVYTILTPIALILIVTEIAYCWITKKDYIPFQDAITNIGTAIGNQCTNLLVAFLVFECFGWINQNFSLIQIPTTWWSFLILLTLFDFLFYWFHRHGHSYNLLWAAHMPHHSSEEMNLFVAVRASITQRLFSFFYMWPLAILGFSAEAIYAASGVQLILAFWHHTKTIGKMGWFEKLFNSPSYHRVHHGINKKYLDKNFGEIFIVWDKMFGTYQKEEEEVVYGCKTQVASWDPNKIYFQFYRYLWFDCMNTKSWWDKLRLWFMPLGWRPEDVRHLSWPGLQKCDEFNIKKYQTPMYPYSKLYLTSHVLWGLLLMFVTISHKTDLNTNQRILMSFLVLWPMITSWGALMERKKWALGFESFRLILSTVLISYISTESSIGTLKIAQMVVVGLSFVWIAYQVLNRDKLIDEVIV